MAEKMLIKESSGLFIFTYCDYVTVCFLIKFILDASFTVEGDLHVDWLLGGLPLVHKFHKDLFPLRGPLEAPDVHWVLGLRVKIVIDDRNDNSIRLVIFWIFWETLPLWNKSPEGVVGLDRSAPLGHAAYVELVTVCRQSGVVGASQKMIQVIPCSRNTPIIPLGIKLDLLNESLVILPVGQHILDVALVNLRAEGLVAD